MGILERGACCCLKFWSGVWALAWSLTLCFLVLVLEIWALTVQTVERASEDSGSGVYSPFLHGMYRCWWWQDVASRVSGCPV